MSPAETQRSAAKRGNHRKRFLYQAVCDALRWRLSQQEDVNSGGRLPPLRELARRFNVSTITVRQALRHLEKEGHLQCIPGVGVFLQPVVPSGTATRQATIAFATIEIENAVITQITQSIEEACMERGWGMQLLSARGDTELEARNLSQLARSDLAGAIILPADSTDNLEGIIGLKLHGLPIVLVNQAISGLKVDVVESDHEKGARLATEYLLKHGHRRVLMVARKPGLTSVAGWLRGYDQAFADCGLEPLRAWKVWTENTIENKGRCQCKRWLGGYAAIQPVLKGIELPVAVLAQNADSGWGILQACRELGLNVPNDVSIVCLDDAEFTRALTPPITAVRQRTDEIARTAVELLERRLSNETSFEPQHILLDVELIERESVASVSGITPSRQCQGLQNR